MSTPAAQASTGTAFNPFDPAFLENPFPFYALGRQFRPVMYNEARGLWSVFKYEDCVSVLKDHATWSSNNPGRMPEGQEPSMLGADPPRHQRLRALVSQAFTPRMVEQLEPRIRQVANELLDAVPTSGTFDIVDALTYPLPVIMIAEIIGIPAEDRDRFKVWSDAVVATLGTGAGSGSEDVDRALPMQMIDELNTYFTRMIEDRRRQPRADLLSALVAAEERGDRLSSQELMQMLVLLLVAGNETTTNLIGNAILEFMAHPAELAKVRANPRLIPAAIEEVMRYSSPVQATVRRATRDVELGGKTISAEQQCLIWLASANRDESQFPDADRFDVTRSPNRHIGFGLGIHFCLGAPLARMEAAIALETFLARYSNFERSTDGSLPRIPTFIMHGVRSLPITVS